MLSFNELLFVCSALLGSFIFNFTSIHTMANLILTEGSCKSQSGNLSIQYALLTATIALIGLLSVKITGKKAEVEPWVSLIFVLAGDSGLVFLIKWWYTKKIYDTTYLFSFLIVQWIYIILWIIFLAIINLS